MFNFLDEMDKYVIDDSKVVLSETVVTCPALEYQITNHDDSSLDSSIFSYDQTTKTFTIYSTDKNKIAIYDLKIHVNLVGYTTTDTLDFAVQVMELITACDNPIIVAPDP